MTEINLKTAMAQWVEQQGVRPVDFARKMGYSSAYAWSLLRGQANVTTETLGRFVMAYGSQAAGEVLALASTTEVVSTETLPASANTTIPVTKG
ncbi:MAG: hypothetical protein CVU44_06050 [Chloroflexi bacterium HGW-Chloroflexi-6]|nr:MAG: hypothetical protein CVU44_06050 [Chloroflexi bacterium HGW-Chloroflexi-6]